MYALIESGGQQHKVEPGRYVTVRRLAIEEGQPVVFDRVLLVRTDADTTIGSPVLDGVTVQGTVRRHLRGKKINALKYRPKKGYSRRWGARADLTQVDITDIVSGSTNSAAKAEAAPAKQED